MLPDARRARRKLYGWRSMTFLQMILTDRPTKWLPSAYKNYDELLVAAADRAVDSLANQARASASRIGPGSASIRSTCSIRLATKDF